MKLCSLFAVAALALLVQASMVAAAPVVRDNGAFSCTFYNDGEKESWTGTPGNVDWSDAQISSVMRAMDTIAGLFSNEASRKVNVSFVYVNQTIGTAASAVPLMSTESSPPYAPKTKSVWTADDLGGRGVASGSAASVNNLEDVWKYGHYLPSNSTDVVVTISSALHLNNSLYYGVSASGIQGFQFDMETVILHEMAHPLGFYAPGRSDSKTALEVLTSVKSYAGSIDPKFFDGATTVAYLQEHGMGILDYPYAAYETNDMASLGVEMSKDGSHISKWVGYKDILMGDMALSGVVRRNYSDLELAMFKDMGWSLANDPFVAVPEPSSVILSLFGLSGLLLRRRRTA